MRYPHTTANYRLNGPNNCLGEESEGLGNRHKDTWQLEIGEEQVGKNVEAPDHKVINRFNIRVVRSCALGILRAQSSPSRYEHHRSLQEINTHEVLKAVPICNWFLELVHVACWVDISVAVVFVD